MKFCPECENYLIMQVDEDESNSADNMLKYTCNNCGYIDKVKFDKDAICIYQNNYQQDKFRLDNININYLVQDPTLPRVKNLQCPNSTCPSHNNQELSNILFINIDDSTKTFLYKCNNCDKTWTNK
jgi:DNA-directed RNA polymerase subunit M/transcription elongation factor TFIIS